MIQGFKGVKYGLQVPAIKKKSAPVAKPGKLAAFGDDDNSDGEHEAVPQQLARQAASKKSNNKVDIGVSLRRPALMHLIRGPGRASQ